ncbi:MAG: helix-turn-helix transcriptional regulator [Bacteroidota bacterium]
MRALRCIFIFWWVISAAHATLLAQYRIQGTVNLQADWQPQIYLAAIDKLNDYYRASADLVIQIAPIQADGSFEVKGDNLPNEPRFYRLYLMKEQNQEYNACLYFGTEDHNFIHIVLDNKSQLTINADKQAFSPFGGYQVKGDRTNQLMQQLSNRVYPSIEFYQFRFPTEQKLSAEKLHQDLKIFSDTCSSTLVSLAAVNYTDFDEYFDQDRIFYEQFGKRLKAALPNSVYTKNYFRKLQYYGFEEMAVLPSWIYWIITLLSLSLLIASYAAFAFYKKLQLITINTSIEKPIESVADLYDKLTLKEREILALIQAGKANKEIASQLFIGVSTVKTHINKIYSKLEVRSRKEVVSKIRNL